MIGIEWILQVFTDFIVCRKAILILVLFVIKEDGAEPENIKIAF